MALSSSASSVGLGLVAATTWGGSDFAGGIGARRSPALLVAASGHLITLLLLLFFCALNHLPIPHRTAFLEGAIGGLEGSFALALFYKALSMGAMGLTAALTGLMTALVPVIFGLSTEGFPTPLAICGLLLGVVAIALIAHAPQVHAPASALWLGAISGAGFGLQLILLKLASSGGVLWALTSARIGGVLGFAVFLLFAWPTHNTRRVIRGFWGIGIAAGVLDTIGNIGYTVAAHQGRLDLAAVVSSLYPGFTILLAAMLLRERPTQKQTLGMIAALASVLLLTFQ